MQFFLAIICLLLGVSLFFWVKKRRFDRVNQYGFEAFKSYRNKIIATYVEKTAWVLGIAFIVIGLFFMFSP